MDNDAPTQTSHDACRPRPATVVAQAVPLFRALGDPTRARLFCDCCTCSDAQPVSQLAECCQVDLSVVSRHLKILAAAGLLAAEKKGRYVHYSADRSAVAAQLRALADVIEGQS